MRNKICNLIRLSSVSANGHPRLKKNLGQKQRGNESTLTNITEASVSFLT